ncbi:MAG: phage integrase family protein, partial [bacterium]|nr:phage integrase family protein [bacterium]
SLSTDHQRRCPTALHRLAGCSGIPGRIKSESPAGCGRNGHENLTTFQCDLANARINLMPEGAQRTKKRKPIVPMYPEIRPVVERLLSETDTEWLFGQRRSFYRPFVTLLKGTGLEAHPHMLRHSRATHMLIDGEDIYKVARLLGDTVATIERNYGHTMPEYLETDSGLEVIG